MKFVSHSDMLDKKDYPFRDLFKTNWIMLHRVGMDLGKWKIATLDARGVVDFYATIPQTGRKMPYTFTVSPNGTIEQVLPLSRETPHARSHSKTAVGVGVMGDFRHRPPTEPQIEALIALLYTLKMILPRAQIIEHVSDILSATTHDPGKVCPGPFLDVKHLADAVLVGNDAWMIDGIMVTD